MFTQALQNMIDLNNKTILITGASSGIGRATAVLCDRLGATVILTGRNSKELFLTQNLLQNKSEIIIADLSSEEEIIRLTNEMPAIDGFAHCAGIVKPYPIKYLKAKHITEVMNINFSSGVLLSSYLLNAKKMNNGASAVFISSVSAWHPYTGGALYSASKSALEAFARSFALEHAPKKMRANIVAPALVRTKILEDTEQAYTKEEFDEIAGQYPLGLGEPTDVANTIAFLLSDASKWITGTTIKMDGGLLLSSKK
jgi:NAD(P)-dependent dehydrogenase (short-subunit alcohol dehydrogenase family)